MRRVIAKGRQLGKSTLSLADQMLQHQSQLMQRSIDRMVMEEIWSLYKYRIHKSWTDRRGHKMYRISANDEVREWLDTEHSQYGVSNPDWWKFENKINITDKLFTLLVLRFAE